MNKPVVKTLHQTLSPDETYRLESLIAVLKATPRNRSVQAQDDAELLEKIAGMLKDHNPPRGPDGLTDEIRWHRTDAYSEGYKDGKEFQRKRMLGTN